MDEGRIERALREGPPGEDAYVPHPVDLGGREPRRRTVSTRSPLPAGLALAVVAILVGLAAFGRGLVPGSGPSVFGGAAATATRPATVLPATPPVASPTVPPPTPVPSSATPAIDVRACRAADLHAAVSAWSGSLDASIRVTNTAPSACRLQGRPGLQLIDGLGFPVGSGPSAQPKPSVAATDPVVVLQPGRSAVVTAAWTSFCGNEAPKGPVTFRLVLPSSAATLMSDPDWGAARQPDPPACVVGSGASGPVIAALGPFEADQGTK